MHSMYIVRKKMCTQYMCVSHATINSVQREYNNSFLLSFSWGNKIDKVTESLIKPQNSSRLLIYHRHQCKQH